MQKVGDLLATNEEMERLIENNFDDPDLQDAIRTAYYKGIEIGRKLN